jgi:hypothetical protein
MAEPVTSEQVMLARRFLDAFSYSTPMFVALVAAMRIDWGSDGDAMADKLLAFTDEFAKVESESM